MVDDGSAASAFDITRADADVYSWLTLNSDLFPVDIKGEAYNEDTNAARLNEPPAVGETSVGDSSKRSRGKQAAARERSKLAELREKEKREKRLEKNRIIARNCRKRRREKAQKMENELLSLRQENRALRLELESQQGSDAALRKEAMADVRKHLGKKDRAALVESLGNYKEMVSTLCRDTHTRTTTTTAARPPARRRHLFASLRFLKSNRVNTC